MPRLDDRLLDCVFYLYSSADAAARGEAAGGTGFLVGLPSVSAPEVGYMYAVTNRHVAVDQGACAMRFNRRNGGATIVETEPHEWVVSREHDLAAIPANFDVSDLKVTSIAKQMFLTPSKMLELNIGPGDDVFMIGRFVNHDGRLVNVPSVRFGNLSMPPAGIMHPGYRRDEEGFAVEMRSMGGYSGSPVFITPSQLDMATYTFTTFRGLFLLGVNWGHVVEHLNVNEKIIPAAHPQGATRAERRVNYVAANTGMNGVVPAWRLRELLNDRALKRSREANEARVAQAKGFVRGGSVEDGSQEGIREAE